MLPSQVRSKRAAERQRETLQQFTTSNFHLLVVVDGDSQTGTLPDDPSTNFEYNPQIRADHPVPNPQTVFEQDVFHPVTQPSPQLYSTAQAKSAEPPQTNPKEQRFQPGVE